MTSPIRNFWTSNWSILQHAPWQGYLTLLQCTPNPQHTPCVVLLAHLTSISNKIHSQFTHSYHQERPFHDHPRIDSGSHLFLPSSLNVLGIKIQRLVQLDESTSSSCCGCSGQLLIWTSELAARSSHSKWKPLNAECINMHRFSLQIGAVARTCHEGWSQGHLHLQVMFGSRWDL